MNRRNEYRGLANRVRTAVASVVAGVLISVASMPAGAAITCEGSVSSVLVFVDGLILIRPSWHAQHIPLCSTATAWGGIGVQTCDRWHAQAQLAQSTQTVVRIEFPASAAAQCDQVSNDVPGSIRNAY